MVTQQRGSHLKTATNLNLLLLDRQLFTVVGGNNNVYRISSGGQSGLMSTQVSGHETPVSDTFGVKKKTNINQL